jgi:DNA-binding response OmpR family regulator
MSLAHPDRIAITDQEGLVVDILLVEDSPSDAMMTREALECSKLVNQLYVVDDGVEAMDFLHRRGKYAGARRPGLVLLDLNLPRKSGLEVLKEIKEDRELMTIPVVVLTTSKAEEDVVKSYGAHANCYITKPIEFSRLADAVRAVGEFWLSVVTLPPESRQE